MRRAALIPLLLLTASAVTATAVARPAPQSAAQTPQLSVDPDAVTAGTAVTLQGQGFPRNAHVALLAGPPHEDAIRIGGATTGRAGRFTATVHIRPRSAPGPLVALACSDGCRVKASVRFRIVAP
jgi:hypothetical protein